MLDVGLVHPFKPDGLDQPDDALEARTGVHGQSIKLGFHLGNIPFLQ
jgi:hypothetical protein